MVCILGLLLLLLLYGRQVVTEYQVQQQSQQWTPAVSIVTQTTVRHREGRNHEIYLPQLFVSYTFRGHRYQNIELDTDLPKLSNIVAGQTPEKLAKQLYPEGGQTQILINPTNPIEARSYSYREKPIDKWMLGMMLLFGYALFRLIMDIWRRWKGAATTAR